MKEFNCLLKMCDIHKSFPGVLALDGVNFSIKPGEVHALLGENGAGKSTLMKILSGAYSKDSGDIYIKNQPAEIRSPLHAQELGIAMIYQEFNLAPHLSVGANVFIGREPVSSPFGFIRNRDIKAETEKILKQLDVELDSQRKVKSLNVCQQQITEIAKALSIRSDIFIMDEPTSALMESEVDTLFKIIARLKAEGKGIIYISHNMDEVFTISDTITILRDGKHIISKATTEITPPEAVRMMVGRDIAEMYPENRSQKGEIILEIENLSTASPLHDISFSLRQGEILGISGLLGAGRTELARALFGADPLVSGTIRVAGKPVSMKSISQAMKAGIGFVPEDRKAQGLFVKLSVVWNLSAPNMAGLFKRGILQKKQEHIFAGENIKKLGIKVSGIYQKVAHLSGGNQQKVVLSKWLARNPKILILDDPTRGIDVGAKHSIYNLMIGLAEEGMGIIFISSELPEVLGISDRVLVMSQGTIQGELSRPDVTPEAVMRLLTCNHHEGVTA